MAFEGYQNPRTALFHVLFKGLAVAFYICCKWISSSFVIHFVVCVLLLALDFWTVKNVSGRRLVGLRWWNETDENGESVWRFESLDQQAMEQLHSKDAWLFWSAIVASLGVWVLFGIVAILNFSPNYLLIVGIAIVLNGANIIGFFKCRKDAKAKLQGLATEAMVSHLTPKIHNLFSA
ncbi:hypothetical protein CBR_g30020 [Chara braunii]|uniref:Golgi apparatus membrane protein TVP23 n=1 Tax=Chara braunii TaxID=69332 RepID=A0A388LBT8_CHABU|nr:hypothetical protein CBR_g30020 [Chara braunii]|eukprot:GBG79756.1 hypothetical protein CBR_g30020 [Chara braunii]